MTMQASAAPTSAATVGLYLLKLRFTPKHGMVGAGSMTLAVTVDAVSGDLNGQANGSILEGSEYSSSFSADAKGAMHSTGYGSVVRVGAVHGEAFVSFPPPAIGSYLAPFSASFQVDDTWQGTGQFTVGVNTYQCDVAPCSEGDNVILGATTDVIQGAQLNLQVLRGLSSNRSLLSCSEDGSVVDLWSADDGSGRQKWSIVPVQGFSEIFNIVVDGGVSTNKRYLSCTADGSRVDLYPKDDGSGRQRWSFVKLDSNIPAYYNIKIVGGVETGRLFLSCSEDGLVVDLWSSDDGSGRQRWQLQ
jgi:hypothetical protein